MPDPGPRPRYCNRCGYDALGVTGPVCPECGWPLDRVISLWRDGTAPFGFLMTVALLPPLIICLLAMAVELAPRSFFWVVHAVDLVLRPGGGMVLVLLLVHAAITVATAWRGSVRYPGERAVFATMFLVPADVVAAASILAIYVRFI